MKRYRGSAPAPGTASQDDRNTGWEHSGLACRTPPAAAPAAAATLRANNAMLLPTRDPTAAAGMLPSASSQAPKVRLRLATSQHTVMSHPRQQLRTKNGPHTRQRHCGEGDAMQSLEAVQAVTHPGCRTRGRAVLRQGAVGHSRHPEHHAAGSTAAVPHPPPLDTLRLQTHKRTNIKHKQALL